MTGMKKAGMVVILLGLLCACTREEGGNVPKAEVTAETPAAETDESKAEEKPEETAETKAEKNDAEAEMTPDEVEPEDTSEESEQEPTPEAASVNTTDVLLSSANMTEEEVDQKNMELIGGTVEFSDEASGIAYECAVYAKRYEMGLLQNAELWQDTYGEYYLDVVAEDGTNYEFYMGFYLYVDAIQNLDTGEFILRSYQ